MPWRSQIGEHGIDLFPDGEMGYHVLDVVDPLTEKLLAEDGTILRCLCRALVTVDTFGIKRIWHRSFEKAGL